VVRKPLVIITPKSLLRLPEARSPRTQFLTGSFHEIIDDESIQKKMVRRIILTSGKVYYELVKFRADHKINDTAIIRIEQFYPYKSDLLKEILSSYPLSDKVVSVQEEPKNMGAWNFLSSRLIGDLPPKCLLFYSGRPEAASPAVGSSKISALQQSELVETAFKL
jgi:2-oxoglutarate dehydrogenase E1 component